MSEGWVTFHDAGTSPSGKTRVWRASGSGGDRDTIGWVKWSGAWRQYVFVVEGGLSGRVMLAASCLLQIATFCHNQTAARRDNVPAERQNPQTGAYTLPLARSPR